MKSIHRLKLLLLSVLFIPFQAMASPLYLSVEQRFLALWAIEFSSNSESFTQQKKLLQSLQSFMLANRGPTTVVQVKSFEEFLEKYKGDWPESYSLSNELELAQKRFTFSPRVFRAAKDNVELQNQIDSYLQSQGSRIAQSLAPIFEQTDFNLLQNLVSAASLDQSDLLAEVNGLFAKKVREFGENLAKEFQAIASGANSASMKVVLKHLGSIYFNEISASSKKLMLSALLGSDLANIKEGLVRSVLMSSGPQLQKMLQLIARQGAPPAALAQLLESLESDVKPIPYEIPVALAETVKHIVPLSNVSHKALGVGTMAQVHRAQLKLQGEDKPVAVRFLKPNIEARVEEDHRILTLVAAAVDADPVYLASKAPPLSPLIDEISDTVRAELNIRTSIDRQIQASKVYNKSFRSQKKNGSAIVINFAVPKIFDYPDQTAFSIQELVPGKKLESVAEEFSSVYPKLTQSVMESLTTMWMEEAIFGSGFYHSDLHQGNLLVQMGESELTAYVLDYGMSGQLSRSLQTSIWVLSAAVELGDFKSAAKTLMQISQLEKNKISQSGLLRVLEQKQAAKGASSLKFTEVIAAAIEAGVVLNADLIGINRGLYILDSGLTSSGSEKTYRSIGVSLAIKHAATLAPALAKAGLDVAKIPGYGAAFIRQMQKSKTQSCKSIF